MRTPKALDRLVTAIEQAEALDRPAGALADLVSKAVRPGPVEDVLSGVPGGHPLHPALVAVPIGAWVSAGVMDALGDTDSARTLIGLGLLSALPAAASGASDWASTHDAEQRVGFVHALANYAALGAYGLSFLARRRGAQRAGFALSIAGATAMASAGWLGGHLSYAQGVGVDTTAFEKFPADWTDVGPAKVISDDGSANVVYSDGVPILLAYVDGQPMAMGDRCTHRGAPLHEGSVDDGCITCPWHSSVFDLHDGTVRSGPASRPQPTLDVRVRDGRVEVRRHEQRALRANVAGP